MQPVIKKVGSAVGGAVVDKLKDVVTDKLQSAFDRDWETTISMILPF